MRQERKTAPEQSATQYHLELRSGARWCERGRRLAGGGAARTGGTVKTGNSTCNLHQRAKHIRSKKVPRNTRCLLDREYTRWRRDPPLPNGLRRNSDLDGKRG